jgi:hypothetical protein
MDMFPGCRSDRRPSSQMIDIDAYEYEHELAQEERNLEAIAQLKRRILGK